MTSPRFQAGPPIPEGKGYGTRIETVAPLLDFVLDFLVKDMTVYNEKAALPDKGRPLVFLAAHGSLYAPTPGLAALGRLYMNNGLGDTVAGIYPHKSLMWIPGVRRFFAKMGTPSKAYNVDDLVELLDSGKVNITGTALEGLNCHLIWDEYVGPFRTAGMIETAIRTNASLCLLAHQGGDAWALSAKLPFGLTLPLTRGIRGFYIPTGPIRRIKKYGLLCKRYRVGISKTALAKMNRREKRMALFIEMEKIRNQMNLMTDDLRQRMEKDALS